MTPRFGEVWMVDMGMVAKVRPAVVILNDQIEVDRVLVVFIPITSKNRNSVLEIELGHLQFLTPDSTANVQAISSLPKTRFERKLGVLPSADLEMIKKAMRLAFAL